jgi:arabinose-5-phosphate isomerase
MHSTEGVHGDLGMIQQEDIVILISNSGETAEVLSLLPSPRIPRNGESVVGTSF